MKKFIFFATVAALFSMASCQKEESNERDASGSPVFSAAISAVTKTNVDAATGKVSWVNNDVITITDASQKTAKYRASSIDESTGKAIFTYVSGATLGAGPYKAIYGSEPQMGQFYSEYPPTNLYMTASSETTSLDFTVQCGLMELNLTKEKEYVTSIAVTGTPEGGSETTYTLTCKDAQSIEQKKPFYIALPEGTYNKIVIKDNDEKVCTLNSTSGVTVGNNHIKPVTLGSEKLNFKRLILKGRFTVQNDEGEQRQVRFSGANLWADASDSENPVLHFENAQYNSCTEDGEVANKHVYHFTWSSTVQKAVSTEAEGGFLFCDEEHKQSVDGSEAIFYALSKNEWNYLLNERESGSTVGGTENARFAGAIVKVPDEYWDDKEIKGIILFSDNYEHPSDVQAPSDINKQELKYEEYNPYELDDWEKMEEAGAVFLPLTGLRYPPITTIGHTSDGGYYWLSKKDEIYGHPYHFENDNGNLKIDGMRERTYGYSIRLVADCQE